MLWVSELFILSEQNRNFMMILVIYQINTKIIHVVIDMFVHTCIVDPKAWLHVYLFTTNIAQLLNSYIRSTENIW